MAQGDAFNRAEVSSVYVGPKARFVVSLIVGVEAADASSPEAAARAVLEMTRSAQRADVIWCVYDRETGDSFEVAQVTFDTTSLPAPRTPMVEIDPFPKKK
jgi:hypothetical protein